MHAVGRSAESAKPSADVRRFVSPLEGMDQAIHALADLIRTHRRADTCAIAVQDPRTGDLRLYRADTDAGSASRGKRMDVDSGLPELLLPRTKESLIVNVRGAHAVTAYACNAERGAAPRSVTADRFAALARFLETDSFISIPLQLREGAAGCIHIGSRRARLGARDLPAFTRLAEQAAVMIENVRLVGRLALELATEERKRISRDLHDGTIQPYIGLKLGLEALRRKIPGEGELAAEVDELLQLARESIGELRDYVGTLKGRNKAKKDTDLLQAIRHQAQKFTDFYGVDTRVVADQSIAVSAALRDEVIHIVREGLSNIRRHTRAKHATVRVQDAQETLRLEIINDHAGAKMKRRQPFVPRSISERVSALGGRLHIQQRNGGRTVVQVEVPL